MKYVIKLIFIITLALPALSSFARDSGELIDLTPVTECRGLTDEQGNMKMLSAQICPNDELILAKLKSYPATIELALKGTKLFQKNVDGIIKNAKIQHTLRNSNLDLAGEERASIMMGSQLLLVIAIIFAIAYISYSFFKMMTSADDNDSEKERLKFYIAMCGVALFMSLKIPSQSSVVSENNGVNVAAFIFAYISILGYSFGLFVQNIISHTLTTNFVDEGLMVGGVDSVTYSAAASNLPLTRARNDIEMAVCINQAALLGVYRDAQNGLAANTSTYRNGSSLNLSTLGDSAASMHELKPGQNSVKITSGWGMEHDLDSATICGTQTLVSPVEPEAIKPFSKLINKKLDSLRDASRINRDSAFEAWVDIYRSIQADENPELDKELMADRALKYFFSALMFNAEGGAALVRQEQEAMERFNKRSALADVIAKELRLKSCLSNRAEYIRNRYTVKALNAGNVGVSEFSISCSAVHEGGDLALLFNADDSTASSFTHSTLEVAAQHPQKIADAYAELLGLYEPEAEVQLAFAQALKNLRVDSAIASLNSASGSKAAAIEARKHGMSKFGSAFLGTYESNLSVSQHLATNKEEKAALQSNISATKNFDSQTAYLPSNIEGEKGITDVKIVLPAYMFNSHTDESAGAGQTAQESFDSVISTMSGNTSTSNAITNTGLEYETGQFSADTKTHEELVLDLSGNVIGDAFDIVSQTRPHSTMTETELRYSMLKACDVQIDQSVLNHLERTRSEMVAYCSQFLKSPMMYFKEQGIAAITLGVEVIATTITVGASAFLAKKALSKFNRKKGVSSETDGGLADSVKLQKNTSNSSEIGGVDKFFGAASTMFKDLISNTIAIAIVGMVALFYMLGGVFGLLIYHMPLVIFKIALFGFETFSLTVLFVSPMLWAFILMGGSNRWFYERFGVIGVIRGFLQPAFMTIAFVVTVCALPLVAFIFKDVMSTVSAPLLNSVDGNIMSSQVAVAIMVCLCLGFGFKLFSEFIRDGMKDRLDFITGESRTDDDRNSESEMAELIGAKVGVLAQEGATEFMLKGGEIVGVDTNKNISNLSKGGTDQVTGSEINEIQGFSLPSQPQRDTLRPAREGGRPSRENLIKPNEVADSRSESEQVERPELNRRGDDTSQDEKVDKPESDPESSSDK
ncbi:TPA: hypothetical protein NJ268_004441 [Vibrio parahaemolyticus]|nr:hypothetical protein [Vibrio parahaemolyticus]